MDRGSHRLGNAAEWDKTNCPQKHLQCATRHMKQTAIYSLLDGNWKKLNEICASVEHSLKEQRIYMSADKSLARPDWKKQLKVPHFSSDAEVIAVAETWLDGQPSELVLSGLQKLEFGRCSLLHSWSG